jgi:hypothetical protein
MSNSDAVFDLIRKLEQTGLADRPGRLLYSGVGTLCPGQLYLLGDNPGGDPDVEGDSPKEHLEALLNKPSDWNEYVSGIWKPRGLACPPGEAGMQKRVRGLLASLELPVHTVCASNLIFMRSRVVGGLGNREQQRQLAHQCWPVHEYMLELVRPRAILSIGKGAFEFIIQRGLLQSETEDFSSGQGMLKCRATILRLGTLDISLVSVPHLGDRIGYDITAYPEAIRWVREKVWGPAACPPRETALSCGVSDIRHDVIQGYGVTTMASRHNIIPDDYVFTYVRSIDDSQYEKIPGTAGHDRYMLFQTGVTVRKFLDTPLPGNEPRRVDITYNIKVRPRQRTPNLELSPPDSPAARGARAKYLEKTAR